MKHPARLMLLMIVIVGCSPPNRQTAPAAGADLPDRGKQATQLPDGILKADKPVGAWIYTSENPNFSLELPSAGWKAKTKRQLVADFWCPSTTGSPMQAIVMAVTPQSREQFRASIPEFKAKVKRSGEYLLPPTYQEGETDTGNPYVFAEVCEKGKAGSEFVYAAVATVWVIKKEVTVTTLFEGQGRMQSQILKAAEYAEFQTAAKSICLSPR